MGLVQLVERSPDKTEVLGPIPRIHTKVSKDKREVGSIPTLSLNEGRVV